jgi:acyl-CoA thioesterase-1
MNLARGVRVWSRTQVVAFAVFVNVCALLAPAARSEPSPATPIRIVAFGDSLTAGYRLEPADSFPAQLEKALRARGHNVEIANAGVSGDTSAAGLERLAWAVPDGTDGVILELGANDALRGIDPAQTRANLDKIIAALDARGIPILIAGMRAPKNWGDDYAARFDAIFTDFAKSDTHVVYPFFLDGIAMNPALNLDDGMHPNSKGVAEIATRMTPAVEKLLERIQAKRSVSAKP